jgi:hypothetical protein
MNYREAFTKILEIMEYQDDKNEFINTFILACMKEAAGLQILAMPPEKKESFQTKLLSSDTIEKITVLMSEYIPEHKFEVEFQKVLEKNFLTFLTTMRPSLDPEKQVELGKYLSSLQEAE